MKKIFTFLALAFLTSQMNAQTVVNGDFEGSWRDVTIVPGSQISQVPDSWTCSDSLVAALAPMVVLMGYNIVPEQQCYKDTIAHSDSFAVGLKTIMVLDTVVLPAMFTNGKINFDITQMSGGDLSKAITFSGGTPALDKKVDTVKAYVLLDTTNKYGAMINITANKTRDGVNATIGTGSALILPAVGYQEINVIMNYDDEKNTQTDTLLISVISAVPANGDTLKEDGNYVIVDDISATFSEGTYDTVSVNNINANVHLKVYPNPIINDNVNFSLKETISNKHRLVIADNSGKIVYNKNIESNEISINAATYPNGVYTYYLVNEFNHSIESGRVVIRK